MVYDWDKKPSRRLTLGCLAAGMKTTLAATLIAAIETYAVAA